MSNLQSITRQKVIYTYGNTFKGRNESPLFYRR